MMHPMIDPVAFYVGSWGVHWYGLAYISGFFWVWFMGARVIRKERLSWISCEVYEGVLCALMLGLVLGGRVGYMLFYQFSNWLAHPLWVFRIWEGGMSFHGAVVGVGIAAWIQTRCHRLQFLALTDLILPWVPVGLGLGRICNFINGELWGRPTHQDWGVVFPWVDAQLRHPSQLYEFGLEGLLLMGVMLWARRRYIRQGQVTGIFILLYGLIRFAVEYVRMPDAQLGFLFHTDWLTMGQCLSIPMIVWGGYLLYVKAKPSIERSR